MSTSWKTLDFKDEKDIVPALKNDNGKEMTGPLLFFSQDKLWGRGDHIGERRSY